jgi:hypothetical protein
LGPTWCGLRVLAGYLGTDQVMLFPTCFVRLALVRDPETARMLTRAYNDWVYDYGAGRRRRLFPRAVLPIRSVGHSIEKRRRVAERGFKATAVGPCCCLPAGAEGARSLRGAPPSVASMTSSAQNSGDGGIARRRLEHRRLRETPAAVPFPEQAQGAPPGV